MTALLTSDGKAVQPVTYATHITDFLGLTCLMSYTTNSVQTPYGERFQTTVYLYPCLSDGKKAVFVGTTIQSPADEHSYDSGIFWALFRAGEDMLARSEPTPLTAAFFRRYDWDNGRIEKALRRWARHVLRKLAFDGQDANQLALKVA